MHFGNYKKLVERLVHCLFVWLIHFLKNKLDFVISWNKTNFICKLARTHAHSQQITTRANLEEYSSQALHCQDNLISHFRGVAHTRRGAHKQNNGQTLKKRKENFDICKHIVLAQHISCQYSREHCANRPKKTMEKARYMTMCVCEAFPINATTSLEYSLLSLFLTGCLILWQEWGVKEKKGKSK